MPKNNDFKRQVREYAWTYGLRYNVARRQLVAEQDLIAEFLAGVVDRLDGESLEVHGLSMPVGAPPLMDPRIGAGSWLQAFGISFGGAYDDETCISTVWADVPVVLIGELFLREALDAEDAELAVRMPEDDGNSIVTVMALMPIATTITMEFEVIHDAFRGHIELASSPSFRWTS